MKDAASGSERRRVSASRPGANRAATATPPSQKEMLQGRQLKSQRGDHHMATTTRANTKTITMTPEPDEPAAPQPRATQRKEPDGRFRLQVDRQTKKSFPTMEAAETAGLAIKKSHPLLQVAIYDGVASVNKLIELP
jgi:hypothetical protein